MILIAVLLAAACASGEDGSGATDGEEAGRPVERAGYEQIKSAEIVDDKTITFTFKEPFAGYRDLFSPVLPSHSLEGENFNKVWTTR